MNLNLKQDFAAEVTGEYVHFQQGLQDHRDSVGNSRCDETNRPYIAVTLLYRLAVIAVFDSSSTGFYFILSSL